MNKLIYILLFVNLSFSQVGIGTTTPHVSSSLDIFSNNSGLLIPRVVLNDISDNLNPINSPATSLLIYNTNSFVVGGSGEGFYYWSGSYWVKIFDSLTTITQNWTRNGFQLYPTVLSDNVGIGTNNPLFKLHVGFENSGLRVDGPLLPSSGGAAISVGGLGDVSVDKPGVAGGRFIITESGNVGIDSPLPTEKLDIVGRIKLNDGNQDGGKVLTSDVNGVGTWQKVGINNINVPLLSLGVTVPYSTGNFIQTGASITLPSGKYAVNVTMLLTNITGTPTPDNSSFWLRSSFSESSGINPLPTTDIEGGQLVSGNLPGSSMYSILSGTIIINNQTLLPKTYHYVAGRVHAINTTESLLKIGGNLGENSIIAYKLQ